MVDDEGRILHKPESVGEEAAGYRRLRALLGSPEDCLIAMEATGHYWKNLFAWLTREGFSIALINPIRTRRFAEEELQRTKTDHVDAIGIARFAAQKHLQPTRLSDESAQELRHIVHLRERTIQHLEDRVRDLHRAIDLTFPEFTRHVRGLDTELATAILSHYPTARAMLTATVRKLAAICFDGRRRVGDSLASALISAAQTSVGQYQTEPYERQVRYACQDIIAMRLRARELETDIHYRLERDEVGQLLTTIQGIGTLTAAAIIAEAGNSARFRDAAAFASYVGVTPRLHQSGKRTFSGKGSVPLGNARLRRALWMPVVWQ